MNTSSSASEWWEYVTSCLKKNGRTFFGNSSTHKNIKIFRLKKEVKNPEMKMKISRQKLNQWLKICHKTIAKVKNFTQIL